MDENAITQEEAVEEAPQGEPEASTDWKAEARKWEKLAKKGKQAEDELARLKEAQMSEQEKATARAEKAEAELEAMKAETARIKSAAEIAAKEGVPRELLEYCSTSDDMEAFAKAYKELQVPTHAAAPALSSRIVKEREAQADPKASFAKFASEYFNK